MTWPSFLAASISAGVTASGGGAAARTRVESTEVVANAAPPFNMSRREIPLRFIRSFPAREGEVGYTKA